MHCRRRFDEALKLIPKPSQKESNAFLLMKQIQAIYREEGKLNDLSSDERLKQRQAVIKPLVDAFFAYLKTINVSKKDKFGDAVRYALNQEKYLRVFLTDGDVPIDNNASERAIRGFCIGKKNWQMIDISLCRSFNLIVIQKLLQHQQIIKFSRCSSILHSRSDVTLRIFIEK